MAAFIFFGVAVSAMLIIFFALGRPKARAFFGLICPECGAATNKAADFLFNKAKCRRCKTIWR